ncbi:MAG: single-stranded DNA-binding protein [Clostridiales bacterium]|nr:single-stranded DNA-binding protein [Clostridiales bacterium]
MNKIILIGNLTRDPEALTTSGGVNFTRFTIAVNRPFTNASGERVADYFDVICWRQLADRCAKYLNKGSKVGINGSVQRRQYEDKDGVKRTYFDVVAEEVEFLTPKSGSFDRSGSSGSSYAPDEPTPPVGDMQSVDGDELPF